MSAFNLWAAEEHLTGRCSPAAQFAAGTQEYELNGRLFSGNQTEEDSCRVFTS